MKNQLNVHSICSSLLHTALHQADVKGIDDVTEMCEAVKEITNNIALLTLGANMHEGILPSILENSLTSNLMLGMTLLVKTNTQGGFSELESETLEQIEAATRELRVGIDSALGMSSLGSELRDALRRGTERGRAEIALLDSQGK